MKKKAAVERKVGFWSDLKSSPFNLKCLWFYNLLISKRALQFSITILQCLLLYDSIICWGFGECRGMGGAAGAAREKERHMEEVVFVLSVVVINHCHWHLSHWRYHRKHEKEPPESNNGSWRRSSLSFLSSCSPFHHHSPKWHHGYHHHIMIICLFRWFKAKNFRSSVMLQAPRKRASR